MTTLTIMRVLPREVDPAVFHMVAEDPGNVSYAEIGGLNEQIRELREVYLSSLSSYKQSIRFPPSIFADHIESLFVLYCLGN